jgi:hypothetical protein
MVLDPAGMGKRISIEEEEVIPGRLANRLIDNSRLSIAPI